MYYIFITFWNVFGKSKKTLPAGYDNFMTSHLHQDAVLRNLHTLTESTQRLSEELKAEHSEIEWRNISAFRNVLVHDYLGIDNDRIWQIVSEDVPRLKKSIIRIIRL